MKISSGVVTRWIRIFDAQNSALRPMSEWFRAFACATQMPADSALDFELCLNELMVNVIRYAYDDARPHRLHITLERWIGSIGATLEDDGRLFDPTSSDEDATPINDRRVGGWGIPLVKAFASELRYERRDGKNRVSIQMRVPIDSSPTDPGIY